MTNSYVDHEVLQQTADGIMADYKQAGKPFTPEQEAQFSEYVAGLVDAEPPTNDQIWETMEILKASLGMGEKENARLAITRFTLQFISGCEHSPETFQLLPMLDQVKEAIKAERYHQAKELMMAFLGKSREIARSM